jgi:hypothetical protein
MATISKTLTTSAKSITIMGTGARGMVSFVDEKGQPAGQATISIKDGVVVETGQSASAALVAALGTVSTEFAALVESMVKAGALDPLSRGVRAARAA